MKKHCARLAIVLALAWLAHPQSTQANTQNDSAIRNCVNYSAWSPVTNLGGVGCLNYCGSNSADACEYNTGSDECYVEFGQGCRIASGYSGWIAKTFNDNHMIQDTVRGGCSLTEDSPVYAASSDACFSHCIGASADFCEWNGYTGDCYSEHGNTSSCYYAGAFQWWSL